MKQKQSFYEQIPVRAEHMGYNWDKIHFILDSIGTNLRILDVGCNDGYIGKMLIDKKNKVYGVDITQRKTQNAQKRGLKATVCDIEEQDLPYKSGYFDVVLLTDVIEHVFDTDLLLKKIYRVLKPDGSFLVTTPNVASLGRRLMLLLGINPFLEYSTKFIEYVPFPVGHIRYYTHSDLLRQLERTGFRNVQTKGDRVNFILFSSPFVARFFPSLSVDIHAIATK